MDCDKKWIVTRVDGRLASISTDWRGLSRVTSHLMKMKDGGAQRVSCVRMSLQEVFELSRSTTIDDIILYGTDFQKKIWTELFKLSHADGEQPRLMSYSEFATICGNRPGIRAVAHAVGLNPLAVLIPCHRIIPKESIDRIAEIEEAAKKTIFKGADIYLFNAIDFGEYSLGKALKRDILAAESELNTL